MSSNSAAEQITQDSINKALWNACDTFRGTNYRARKDHRNSIQRRSGNRIPATKTRLP
ncbi:hypothetical protein [Microbulbifer epialgicus]|uniref:Site-specific DNA-methyltransferase (adenine-specific) n=1 Tax=Microbulbifer epialgicus TaxID=393907 RepID=A0ABV4NWG8_9GAMM